MARKNTARLAGFIYLLLVVTGIFNLIYAPSELVAWDDAAKTVANINASEFLFRLWIVVGVFSYLCFLFLPLVLYQLFESVNKKAAVLMVALSVVSVPISILNSVNLLDVLNLLSGDAYLQAFAAEQINSKVMLLLNSYSNGLTLSQVFWGLWLLPFGYLVFKSGFLSKVLGVFLMVGCFGYLIQFVAGTVFPDFVLSDLISLPAAVGEIGIALWLLIAGAKES